MKSPEVEATAGRVFVFQPQYRRQVEGQQRQPQQRFVGVKVIVRQSRPDRLLKLAQPILERAAPAIVCQRRRAVEFFRLPTDDQKEVLGKQLQLAGFLIRPVDHHQEQPLRMSPRLGSIRSQLDDLLVAFLGRAANGPHQMRRSQPFKHCVALDSPDKTPLFVGQVVECLAIDITGVDAVIHDVTQTFGLRFNLLQEAANALGGMHLPLPQEGVQKTVAQPMAFLHAVVAAGHAVAGHQRMIDRVAIVAVVGGARLLAVDLNRKAVDVDRDASRFVVAAAGAEMPMATLGQAVAQCCTIRRAVGEDVDQPRLRRLTGQTLVERLLAAAVPNGQLHRRIVRQAIGVVLCGVAHRQRVNTLTQQLDQFVADQILPPRIVKLPCQVLGDAQSMIGLAQQQQAAVARDSLIAGHDLDRAIETRLE